MSGHRVHEDMFAGVAAGMGLTRDPGHAKAILPVGSPTVCNLTVVSDTSETRTITAPTKSGLILIVALDSAPSSGSVTITGGTYGVANLRLVGESAVFVSAMAKTGISWVLVSGYGTAFNPVNGLLATVTELNRVASVAARVVNVTASTIALTEDDHDGKIITLNLAAGIAVTLPAAKAGLRFRLIVGTTFTGAASIKSATGADVMIGHALMGNNSDNTVVDWQAVAGSTLDTIDLFGTANSTGGMAGQEIIIEGLAANLWFVTMRGDAAGTEATPFANTVT